MGGSLGEKIGEGASADVHAWAPGRVVKLFKTGVPRRIPWWEARMTRAVFAAGGPAPEVFEEVEVDGRFGFVMPRLDGPTLLQQVKAGRITPEATGALLAMLGLSVHRTPAPAKVLSMREYMARSLELPEAGIPERIATGVLDLIDRLPADEGVAHCDLHPDNVIMTAEGPRLIDWTGAKRGGALLDLACCHFLTTELVVENFGDPVRQQAINAAMQSAYAQLAGMSLDTMRAEIETHLPVVRVFFLLGGLPRSATRARMLGRLEADFAEAG